MLEKRGEVQTVWNDSCIHANNNTLNSGNVGFLVNQRKELKGKTVILSLVSHG
jgi:hypothetical protein